MAEARDFVKLRHAAAVALIFASLCGLSCAERKPPPQPAPQSIGWKLMIPPDVPKPFDSSDWRSKEPIAQWTIVGWFDSGVACKEALDNTIREERGKEQSDHDVSVRVADHLKFVAIKNNAVCVLTSGRR